VSSRSLVVVARHRLHDVGRQHVVAVLEQLLLGEGQVRVAAGLAQGAAGHGARLAAGRGAHERSGRSPLLQLELAVSAEDSLV
jgi:hypothetical protein